MSSKHNKRFVISYAVCAMIAIGVVVPVVVKAEDPDVALGRSKAQQT